MSEGEGGEVASWPDRGAEKKFRMGGPLHEVRKTKVAIFLPLTRRGLAFRSPFTVFFSHQNIPNALAPRPIVIASLMRKEILSRTQLETVWQSARGSLGVAKPRAGRERSAESINPITA